MTFPVGEGTYRGYPVRREQWTIGGQTFDLAWPANTDALLELPTAVERFRKDEYMPYWAQPWPASVLLAEAVLAGETGGGRSAIELGCGVGLVSLAAAARGWSVVASDYDDDAVAFAGYNAHCNGLMLAGCLNVDYRMLLDIPRYAAVFGADLLYERRNSGPVAGWIASALLPGGFALLSDPNRSAANTFLEEAPKAGLSIEERQVETVPPGGLVARGRIWRVTRTS